VRPAEFEIGLPKGFRQHLIKHQFTFALHVHSCSLFGLQENKNFASFDDIVFKVHCNLNKNQMWSVNAGKQV